MQLNLSTFQKAKNKSMFPITRPSLLKNTDPKHFFGRICKNCKRPFSKLVCFFRYSNVLCLPTKASEICAISVLINVIELIYCLRYLLT